MSRCALLVCIRDDNEPDNMKLFSIIIAGGVSPLPEIFGVSLGVFFPFFFVGLWLFLSFVISHLGWRRFALTHPCDHRPSGPSHSIPFATFGTPVARYNNVVRTVATDGGLYLYLFILFRAFHKPFLLPWQSIVRTEPYSFLSFRGHILHIRDAAGSGRLLVRDSLYQQIAPNLPKP